MSSSSSFAYPISSQHLFAKRDADFSDTATRLHIRDVDESGTEQRAVRLSFYTYPVSHSKEKDPSI